MSVDLTQARYVPHLHLRPLGAKVDGTSWTPSASPQFRLTCEFGNFHTGGEVGDSGSFVLPTGEQQLLIFRMDHQVPHHIPHYWHIVAQPLIQHVEPPHPEAWEKVASGVVWLRHQEHSQVS